LHFYVFCITQNGYGVKIRVRVSATIPSILCITHLYSTIALYTYPLKRETDSDSMPKHVVGLGEFAGHGGSAGQIYRKVKMRGGSVISKADATGLL